MAAVLALPSLWGCATNRAQEDRSAASQALRKLPRKTQDARRKTQKQRVAVAVYEVSSSLPELPARGATEMFKTALLKPGQFRVVERAKLSRGVVAEKQLNAAGQSTGTTAQQPLRGAEYIFQAELTEVNAGADNSSTGIDIAGLQLGRGSSSDTIGLDISIVDANTGEVVDAVNVRRALGGSSASASGLGTLVSRVMIERGKTPSAYTPEIQHNSARKESLDVGLRECLEEGVRLLALRFDAASAR